VSHETIYQAVYVQSRGNLRAELAAQGLAPDRIDELAPQKTFPGDRPSSFILLPQLTPQTLGALLALYEHKTFVEGVLWGIDSFDQWGVELGKSLAGQILRELEGGPAAAHDPSTAALVARLKGEADSPSPPSSAIGATT